MPMDNDNLELLIFKKINGEVEFPKTNDYQLAMKSKSGKLQIIEKLPKHWSDSDDIYYLVNTKKRWYKILWGTRDTSISTKAHGEMTLSMMNPLRFLNKTMPDGNFRVRDLQLYLSDLITEYLVSSQLIKLLPDKLLKGLNESLEDFGVEVTTLDLYKGAH
jgi:hypothetical protein